MDNQPAIAEPVARTVPHQQLRGTAASITRAAVSAGYHVTAHRPIGNPDSLGILGKMNGWAFLATHNPDTGWTVVTYRPGWPPLGSTITDLRRQLKSQTPATIR